MSRLCQIKASAGSGKTHTLTRQYLACLVSCRFPGSGKYGRQHALNGMAPGAFGDILAITFTNAAVEEMRNRVLCDLKRAALGLVKIENIDNTQAMACLEAILKDLGQLNVRTIDSLLHQIVRAAALSLGLHPDFKPTFDAADALAPYLERFMHRAENGDQQATRLISDVIDAYLAHGPANGGFLPAKGILHGMEVYLDDVFAGRADNLASAEEVRGRLSYLVEQASSSARLLLEEICSPKTHMPNIEAKAHALTAIRNAANGNFKKSEYHRKATILDLLKKSSQLPRDISGLEKIYATYRENISKLLELSVPFNAYLKNAPVIELARILVQEHMSERQTGNFLPSEIMPDLAREAMDADKGVCEALCRLGSRLSHFLVDEFQDTSRRQWLAIRPLVVEALARGGELTWVGDVKQSVYGWRGAAPELFDEILRDRELKLIAPGAETVCLMHNRRSARQIIEHNNLLFSQLADPKKAQRIIGSILPDNYPCLADVAERVATNFAGCAQSIPSGADEKGFVRIECLGKDAAEFRDFFPERLVDVLKKELLPVTRCSDILILVRKNREATEIARLLLSEEIPVVTENSLLLSGQPLIEQSLALLELVSNPENEVALQVLISGSIFTDFEGVKPFAESIAECALVRHGRPLAQHIRESWPDIWNEFIAPFYERAKLMTPYDTIREWYRRMRVESRFLDDSLFLRSFLELLQNAENSGLMSVREFLDYWNASVQKKGHEPKAHMPDAIDAVKIMTVHKAKGLQAPVVIIPLPESDMKTDANKSNQTIIRNFDGLTLDVPLLTKYAKEYNEAMARDAIEAIDVLYVAFTRPQRALFIFTTESDKSPLPHMADCAGLNFPYCMGEPAKRIETTAENVVPGSACPNPAWQPDFSGTTQPMDWMPNLKIARSNLRRGAFDSETRGTFLHFCLEHMTYDGDHEKNVAAAFAFGLSHSGIAVPDDRNERENLFASLLWYARQPGAARWLRDGWKEQPMLDGEGNELRADLIVREPWGVLVIDYKTGQPSQRNLCQMNAYIDCIKASGQFTGKVTGLLIYLDRRKFVIVSEGRPVMESAFWTPEMVH